jgi:ankyrin repeat protein
VDGYSRTPLHQAVCGKDDDSVKRLIDVIGTQSKVLNQCDTAGYTPLHSACCVNAVFASCHVSEEENDDDKPNLIVRMLLKAGCNPFLLDSNGNSPLHWAVRACDYDATQQLLNLVSKVRSTDVPTAESSTTASDNTAVTVDSEAVREYINLPNQFGETCLHWATRGGMRCCDPLVPLLLSYSANPIAVNKSSKRPIDVAAEGYDDEPHSLATIRSQSSLKSTHTIHVDGKKKSNVDKALTDVLQRTLADRRATRRFLLHHSSSLRTLVLHHPECLDHHPKSISDWETPDRVKTILQRLNIVTSSLLQSTDITNTCILPHEVIISQDFDRGNLELLSRVHSKEYLSFVNQLSKELERKLEMHGGSVDVDGDGNKGANRSNATTKWGLPISSSSLPVVPFTPMVQRSMIKVAESNVKLSDNSDTSFSVGSLRAARRAAGAVQHAVDWYVNIDFILRTIDAALPDEAFERFDFY